jgi:hypothetical protein
MSYNPFLDDYRMPKDAFKYMHLPIYMDEKWHIVRNYFAFINIIQSKGLPNIISFDHDLADIHYKKQNFDYNDETYEKTGYHCAKWLIDYCMDNKLDVPTNIMVHSMNPYGTMNIMSLFKTYEINDYQIVITPTIKKDKNI